MQTKHRNKLRAKLKAIRSLAAVANKQSLTAGPQMDAYLSENHGNLPSDTLPTWNEIKPANNDRAEDSPMGVPPNLHCCLRNAAQAAQQQMRTIDKEHAAQTAKQAARAQQRMIAKHPKQAHRAIFQDADKCGNGTIEALTDPNTHMVTGEPSRIQHITEKFYERQLAAPSFKTGKYLPADVPRN